MNLRPKVMVIDDLWGRPDDPQIRETYGTLLIDWVLETGGKPGRHTAEAVLAAVHRERPQLVLLDMDFGTTGEQFGLVILQALRRDCPTLPVVIFTSLISREHRELVIKCMEYGANEYLEKGPSMSRMSEVVSLYANPNSDQTIYGNSATVRRLRAEIARIAFGGETSVLIIGESGTGKELVANALHRQGPRRDGPFVAKNCAHADGQILDSELFGHERGAFTGAIEQRRGLLEEAQGGVLFLDEVSDMPIELQSKLLRVLETRSFRRLGGTKEFKSQFQLLCAVNRPPEELVETGRLREDFYYRIAAIQIRVPPLRDRMEDVSLLSAKFLALFRSRSGQTYPGARFSAEFTAGLMHHRWPGNIRELRNAIERAVILSRSNLIEASELPDTITRRNDRAMGGAVEAHCSRSVVSQNMRQWPTDRVRTELEMALSAKAIVQSYKGLHWKAEFMRLMYPECKAANAKGFDDLLKRLTTGPWGIPHWQSEPVLQGLIEALRS